MPKKPVKADGRRQRSEASRERIVDAMLELVGEGMVTPSADAVAERAGVGLRTVFRHFENMEGLYREINASMTAEVQPMFARPFENHRWPAVLAELIDRRSRLFERILPYKIAADVHRFHSPFLSRQVEAIARAQRSALLHLVPAALRSDSMFVESLDLILSFETWRRLRKDQKLSQPRARQVLEHLTQVLLKKR